MESIHQIKDEYRERYHQHIHDGNDTERIHLRDTLGGIKDILGDVDLPDITGNPATGDPGTDTLINKLQDRLNQISQLLTN